MLETTEYKYSPKHEGQNDGITQLGLNFPPLPPPQLPQQGKKRQSIERNTFQGIKNKGYV